MLSGRDQGAKTFRVTGNVYTHTITGLVAGAVYNVSVSAGTVQGFTGPAAWTVVNTDRGALCLHICI